MRAVAVIVGSGALNLGADLDFRSAACGRDTPYGMASSVPSVASHEGLDVYLLPRHGEGHRLAPHQINYRANLHLLAEAGVVALVAINTVGGIASEAVNGSIVLPDQLIDYSWGRAHSFADEGDLRHVDFSEPYDGPLRERLRMAAAAAGVSIIDGGVYGCTQGPRFETAAEIVRMERDGCTIVGMTGMPEAGLARELGLPYASVCLIVNPAAGKGAIDLQQIADIADAGMQRVARLVTAFLERFETYQ